MSQRERDELAICACEPHHTGPAGIHGDKSAWRNARYTESDALADTWLDLYISKG